MLLMLLLFSIMGWERLVAAITGRQHVQFRQRLSFAAHKQRNIFLIGYSWKVKDSFMLISFLIHN